VIFIVDDKIQSTKRCELLVEVVSLVAIYTICTVF